MNLHFSRIALERLGVGVVAAALLYPFAGLLAPIGAWMWSGSVARASWESARTSLLLTGLAMVIVVIVGTPVALYVARCANRERIWWVAAFLLSILLPPLALGLLFAIAFGPHTLIGRALLQLGIPTSNSAAAFVATQIYVGAGYYVLGSIAALRMVPVALEQQAALLGSSPWRTFWEVTVPLAGAGLAAALGLAWVRAIGEFGAVMVTAYYPAGMPVQLWTNLQDFGLPAVLPLLVIFIVTTLPLVWLLQIVAQRRGEADA